MAPRILALLLIISAVAYMDRQILAILIEPIKHELNLSDTQAGLLYGFTFAAFFALLGVPIAKRTHRANRSRIIVRSLALFSTMTVLCGFAGSYWQLLTARVGVGIGAALLTFHTGPTFAIVPSYRHRCVLSRPHSCCSLQA